MLNENIVTEYDAMLAQKIANPKEFYADILDAVIEDKTTNLYDEIIVYVDYFYAIDFLIDKYNIINQKTLKLLWNLDFSEIDSLHSLKELFHSPEIISQQKYNPKNKKAFTDLYTICEKIYKTFLEITDDRNYVNIAHVLASNNAPKEAIYKASYVLKTSKLNTIKHSLINLLLKNKKCDSKMIENIHNLSDINIEAIIKHEKTSPKVVNSYINQTSTPIKIALAASNKTSEENLFKLILDGDKIVRTTAYYNSKTSETAKEAAIFAGGIFSPQEYRNIILSQQLKII